MRHHLYSILFIVLAATALPAQAQYRVDIVEGLNIGERYYGYNDLTCKGNNCFVSAEAFCDTCPHLGLIMFLRSIDGGHTWKIQDPHLALDTPSIKGIDLIDSMHAVAFGKYGRLEDAILLSTSDGGEHWGRLTIPKNGISGISFSSATNGILIASPQNNPGTYMTSDGGMRWQLAPFAAFNAWECHDYGNGMYRLFVQETGEVYTTRNGWVTVDSTRAIVEEPSLRNQYFYIHCRFGIGDTMFAYGYHRLSHTQVYPCIARTVDGGAHWVSVYDDTAGEIGGVDRLSDVDRDTIVAGLDLRHSILRSTNHGLTWETDSLICSTAEFIPIQCYGIDFNAKNELVGAFTNIDSNQHYTNWLVVSEQQPANVAPLSDLPVSWRVVPNPASGLVTIVGSATHAIRVFDLLGRELAVARTGIGGSMLDVSSLPSGVYVFSDGARNVLVSKER